MLITNKKINKFIILFMTVISFLSISTKIASAEMNNEITKIIEEKQPIDKMWTIKFNKAIDEVSLSMDKVFVTDMYGKRVDTVVYDLVDNKTLQVINLNKYESGNTYILNIYKNIMNSKNEELDNSYKIYFTTEESRNSYFRIEDTEVITSNLINIKFNQGIDEKALIPIFYEIVDNEGNIIKGSYDTMDLKTIDGNENIVTLRLLENKFREDRIYSLKVIGELKSKHDTRINEGKEQIVLLNTNTEGKEFGIDKVEAINKNTLELTFNSLPDKVSSESKWNYIIHTPNDNVLEVSSIVRRDGNKVRIKLTNDISQFGKYRLRISGVKDYSKVRRIDINNYEFDINQVRENTLKFDAKVVDEKTVEIIFDEKMDYNSACTKYNYLIESRNSEYYMTFQPTAVYFDEITQNRAKLYFSIKLNDKKGYKVRILQNIKNIYGEMYDTEAVAYVGYSNRPRYFDIDSVDFLSQSKLKITFSSELKTTGKNLDVNNYVLEHYDGDNRKVILSCSGAKLENGRSLILDFDGMRQDEDYILKIEQLQGYFGEIIDKYDDGINISY
ncbi:hypothetical protein [Oceanirhabdus sp. W0125-5]|uniref:hypothetical protein n=1 Tax=Oceanirhabdus sp. W0125-5 TaxID=2999116 RepID=UPI0022F32034|nr:hypothetical protein [Oceanirhabdus sp. W0125-5]WBW98653.1 hypothetical protein OW730_07815 [Oceanirhabdus sp. W0125-5]